jgi:gluconokinase
MAEHTQAGRDRSAGDDCYVLALDVGTSSARALLFDAAGAPVNGVEGQRKYAPDGGQPGAATFDAEALVSTVAETVDEALAAAGARAWKIAAVATDTFWHSLLALDGSDHPLTPVITWADTRPRDAAHELQMTLDASALHARTGAPLHASYWPAKLRWLSRTQPAVVAQAAQFVSFGEYLHRRLLGRSVCSLSMASGTGLLQTEARAWDGALLAALGLRPEQFPALGDLRDHLQGLRQEYAQRWPPLKDIPWLPALGDGATANVGSGCAAPGRIAVTVGTSSAVRAVIPLPGSARPPNGLWRYLLDGQRTVVGGALSEGGNLFAWMEHALRLPPLAAAESQAAALPPDGHGLPLLPYLAGERSLGWHAEARATITGLSVATRPEEVLRAGIEALAYRIAAVYAWLAPALGRAASPTVIGSGAALLKSQLLQQVLADTLGVPLHPSRDEEASARGAALLALEVLGVIADAAAIAPHLEPALQPDAQRGARYRQAAERQAALYRLLLGASAD